MDFFRLLGALPANAARIKRTVELIQPILKLYLANAGEIETNVKMLSEAFGLADAPTKDGAIPRDMTCNGFSGSLTNTSAQTSILMATMASRQKALSRRSRNAKICRLTVGLVRLRPNDWNK
jgi:hypothetical protein